MAYEEGTKDWLEVAVSDPLAVGCECLRFKTTSVEGWVLDNIDVAKSDTWLKEETECEETEELTCEVTLSESEARRLMKSTKREANDSRRLSLKVGEADDWEALQGQPRNSISLIVSVSWQKSHLTELSGIDSSAQKTHSLSEWTMLVSQESRASLTPFRFNRAPVLDRKILRLISFRWHQCSCR